MASNGGIPLPLNLWVMPALRLDTNIFWTLDPTNFNDATEQSIYSFKVEDVIAGRTPTVNRVILSYRDLGVATVTVRLDGTDDQQNQVFSEEVVVLGTVLGGGRIKTIIPGISLTAQNLQLTLTRAAAGGPVCLTKVRMEGRVETTPYG